MYRNSGPMKPPFHVYVPNRNSWKKPNTNEVEPIPNTFDVGWTPRERVTQKVCTCNNEFLTPEQNREAAERIALCLNLHDELVGALVEARDYMDGVPTGYHGDQVMTQVEAVLSKVRGE